MPTASAAPPTRVLVFVLGCGMLAYASSSLLVRAAGDVPASALIAGRTLFAIVLLGVLAPRATRDAAAHAGRHGAWVLAGAGAMLAAHFLLWVESLALTSVASASVLVTTTPVQIAVWRAVQTRRLPSGGTLVAVALGAIGAVLIGVGDAGQDAGIGRNPVLGNVLAFLSATVMAAYLGVAARVRQRLTWPGYVVPVYASVAVVAVGYALLRGTLGALAVPETALWCLAMALGPQIIGHGATNYAVRYVSPLMLGLLSLLEPIGASALAVVLFAEVPGALSVAGMALCLAAVAAALVAMSRERRAAAALAADPAL